MDDLLVALVVADQEDDCHDRQQRHHDHVVHKANDGDEVRQQVYRRRAVDQGDDKRENRSPRGNASTRNCLLAHKWYDNYLNDLVSSPGLYLRFLS